MSVIVSSVFLSGLVSGCTIAAPQPPWKLAIAGDGPGDPNRISSRRLKVSNLPKSLRGNPDAYSVFGKEYTVMDSAEGFKERGVASWYGKKFHGRLTSSGEVYDMHQMTAAHKNLPLPTFVRVTRTDTGQSVIVKVNDRGPFVEDRIIDLSYAAAARLDMLESGKAEVMIEALSTHEAGTTAAPQAASPVQAAPAVSNRSVAESQPQQPAQPDSALPPEAQSLPSAAAEQVVGTQFLQVGAYSDESNARSMQLNLQELMSVPTQIQHDADRLLFRVLVGPVDEPQALNEAQNALSSAGIDHYRVTSKAR